MKNFCFYIVAFFLSLPPAAANVEIRTVKTDNSSSSKIASLENVSEKTKRLTIKKETIEDDEKYVDVIADFARADKGDEGYWINGRGVYGNFDAENGVYSVPKRTFRPKPSVRYDSRRGQERPLCGFSQI